MNSISIYTFYLLRKRQIDLIMYQKELISSSPLYTFYGLMEEGKLEFYVSYDLSSDINGIFCAVFVNYF